MASVPFVHFLHYPKGTFRQKYPWGNFIYVKTKIKYKCLIMEGGLRIEKIS